MTTPDVVERLHQRAMELEALGEDADALWNALALIEAYERKAKVRPKDCPALNHCLTAINERDEQRALIEAQQKKIEAYRIVLVQMVNHLK